MSATIEANRPVLEESPHLLQAQAAAYVAENISNQWDMETSLAHVALIGSGVSMPDAVVRERAWLPSDEDDKGGVAGEAIFTKDAFESWIQDDTNANGEAVTARIRLLEAYRPFEDHFAALKQDIERYETPEDHPDFLGMGSYSMGFVLHTPDGDYAVRIPRPGRGPHEGARVANEAVEIMDRARGVDGAEQMVAMSIKDGTTVSELITGRDGFQMKSDDIARIKPEHLDKLVATLEELHERGIRTDGKASNFMYDPDKGFTALDFALQNASEYHQSLNHKLSDVEYLLSNSGGDDSIDNMIVRATSASDYADIAENMGKRLPLQRAYYEVCLKRQPDDTELLAFLKDDITKAERTIATYSDPSWFAAERERRRSAQHGDDNDFI